MEGQEWEGGKKVVKLRKSGKIYKQKQNYKKSRLITYIEQKITNILPSAQEVPLF